jgi:hypothetical protein
MLTEDQFARIEARLEGILAMIGLTLVLVMLGLAWLVGA